MNLQNVSKSIKPKGKPYSVPDWASYIEKGAGAPVVLIHGLAASFYDWEYLMPELASAGYHSYALDILGHGDSPKPEARSYKLKWVLRHLEQWIDSLNLTEPSILIGHSLGSYLAMRYTLRHPERVRAMVLASPFYRIDQLLWMTNIDRKGLVFIIGVDLYQLTLGEDLNTGI